MSIPYHRFNRSKKIEDKFDPILRASLPGWPHQNVKDDPVFRKKGVVYLVSTPAGGFLQVEYKACARSRLTGNASLEIASIYPNATQFLAGWMLTSEAGLLRYHCAFTRVILLADLQRLRGWLLSRLANTGYKIGAAVNGTQSRITHISLNFLVPLEELKTLSFVACLDMAPLISVPDALPRNFINEGYTDSPKILGWANTLKYASSPAPPRTFEDIIALANRVTNKEVRAKIAQLLTRA